MSEKWILISSCITGFVSGMVANYFNVGGWYALLCSSVLLVMALVFPALESHKSKKAYEKKLNEQLSLWGKVK